MRFAKLLAIPALAAIGFFGFTATASASTVPSAPTGSLQTYGPTGGLHPCTATSIHCKPDSLFPIALTSYNGHGNNHGQGSDNHGQNGNGDHGQNGQGDHGQNGHGNSHDPQGHCHFPQASTQGQFSQDGRNHGNGCGHDSCGCQVQTISFTSSHRGHFFTEAHGGPALHSGEVLVINGQTFTVTWADGNGHFTLSGNPHIRGYGQAHTVCTGHDNGHGHGGRDGGPVRAVA